MADALAIGLTFSQLGRNAKDKVRELYNEVHVDDLKETLHDYLAESLGEDAECFDSRFEVCWSVGHCQGDFVAVGGGGVINGADVEDIEEWVDLWAGLPLEWRGHDLLPEAIDFDLRLVHTGGGTHRTTVYVGINDDHVMTRHMYSAEDEPWTEDTIETLEERATDLVRRICDRAYRYIAECDLDDDFFAGIVEGVLFDPEGQPIYQP